MAQIGHHPHPSIIPPEVAKDTGARLNMIRLQQWNKIIAHEWHFLRDAK